MHTLGLRRVRRQLKRAGTASHENENENVQCTMYHEQRLEYADCMETADERQYGGSKNPSIS